MSVFFSGLGCAPISGKDVTMTGATLGSEVAGVCWLEVTGGDSAAADDVPISGVAKSSTTSGSEVAGIHGLEVTRGDGGEDGEDEAGGGDGAGSDGRGKGATMTAAADEEAMGISPKSGATSCNFLAGATACCPEACGSGVLSAARRALFSY